MMPRPLVGDAVAGPHGGRTARGPDGRIRVAVLGSTGSIGVSALGVIERHPERFVVTVLAANRSVDVLAAQARRHEPALVIVCDEDASGARGMMHAPGPTRATRWLLGRANMIEAVAREDVDVVVNALVGFAGLEPSLGALEAGKRLALANKESLVAGGELVGRALGAGGGELVPIDSEHSAILQCLAGQPGGSVAKIVLTASGGPFRGWSLDRLARARPSDALRHPTWDMGAKVTVDSATLANKALEVIEAHFLYDVPYRNIEAVVHPQSIVHSLVEFVDGSVVAQLGFPTMELPILYALTYPERAADAELRTFDVVRSSPLTFERIDLERFPLFGIGCEAGRSGGTAPAVFNAANEVAVAAFLADEIPFPAIGAVVEETLARIPGGQIEGLSAVLEADREARRVAGELTLGRRPIGPGSKA
jgi:1-deoxy-D-xylulose-5-phosphate reductoisomerase